MHFVLSEFDKSKDYHIQIIKGNVQKNYKRQKISGKSLPFLGYILKIKKHTYPIELFYTENAETLSKIVEKTNSIGGINGGFWDNNKMPLDFFMYNGNLITPLTNMKRPILLFDSGNIKIEKYNENFEYRTKNLNILQTGPLLLFEKTINLDYSDYTYNATQFDSDITKDRHPRSIFGYDEENYFFIAIDGRSRFSAGLYLDECAQITKELGLINAINLDGGASSTLIMNNKRLNHPRFSFIRTSRYLSAPVPGKERKIPNAILIHKKK